VLETLPERPLFYYVTPNLTRRLSGKVLLNPWQGDRERDPIDVGILDLCGEGLPPYPQVNKFSLDASHLRPTLLPRSGRRYMVLGFPASKSKANPKNREMAATLYGFHSDSIEDNRYSEHGVSSETSVALPLDLEVGFDSTGNHRNFPNPQGMSGSPIWVLYNEDPGDDLGKLQIVAVATKYRKNRGLVIGTDISVILEMISDYLRS
jgi:hypothetical protein